MPSTLDYLKWRFLTGVVNDIKTPPTFFRRLGGFGNEKTYPTETIEAHFRQNVIQTAPFVRRDAEAVEVQGRNWREETIKPPNIRLKMNFSPNTVLETRVAGTGIYINGKSDIAQALQRHIASDLEQMRMDIDTTIEWMCSKILVDGKLSYSQADEDNFSIDLQRHADMTHTTSAVWSGVSTADPLADFDRAKTKMMEHAQAQPDVVVMGTTAAKEFLACDQVRTNAIPRENFALGQITVENNYSAEGARYLGTWAGLPVWEYASSVIHKGSAVDLMPLDKVLFLHRGSRSLNELAFGAIPEMQLLTQGTFQRKIFSKSWRREDPSGITYLTHTRPFPWMKVPNTAYLLTT